VHRFIKEVLAAKRRIDSKGGGGFKTSSAKGKEPKKDKKVHRDPIECPNCGELRHRQSSYKCPFNGTEKRQEIIILFIYCLLLF
jgi:hypothetical protein